MLIIVGFLYFYSSDLAAQNVLWSNNYSNLSFNLTVQGLRSNSSGENYIVGSFSRTIDFDAGPGIDTIRASIITGSNSSIAGYISKTDNAGNHMWAKALIPYAVQARCVINDIDMDANANIYVAGTFNKTIDFDPGPGIDSLNSSGAAGAFIMKLDPAGNLVWVHTFLGTNTNIWDIIIDENDGLMVAGSFSIPVDFDPSPAVNNLIPSGTDEVFVFKMDANSNFLWAKSWAGSKPINRSCIDADDANNIYVSGDIATFQIDVNPDAGVLIDTGQSFVVKLDPAGNFIWGHASQNGVSMVHAANSCDLYVFGSPDPYGNNPYLSEYDSTGTLLWSKMLEDPIQPLQNFAGGISSITQDLQGNLVMGGSIVNKYFIYTTDSLGNMLWVKKSNASFNLNYLTVKMNPLNEILVAGDFYNVLDVDFGAGIDTLGGAGMYSSFLMKYNYCGNNYNLNYSACDSVVLVDTTYLVSANYLKEFQDVNGCDSSVYTHVSLGILPNVQITGCDSAVYNGLVYYQSGIYNQVVTPNVPGCDSILDIHVYINTDTNLNPFMQLIQEVPVSLIATNAGSVFVEVDSLYNMYIGGIYSIYIPQLNMNPDVGLVARFDSSGNLVWKHAVKDNYSVHTKAIALDDNLNLHASTMYTNYGVADANSKGIVEYTNFNNIADDTSGFGPFPPNDKYLCILNDPSSSKMVKIGSVPTAYPNNPSAVIVKRGNNSITFGAVANAWGTGSCYGETGAIDSQGNIYVSGKWQDAPLGAGPGQSGLHACFIAKLDSNLNLLWNKLIDPATSYSKLTISNMKFDNNSLLVSGNFNRKLDLDYTANTYYVYPVDGSAILARFDTSANIMWATPYGTMGNVTPYGLTVDDGGQIYVSGLISDNVDLQPGPGISYFKQYCQNSSQGYISKFSSTGTFIRVMGMHDYMTSIKFKSPNRIYAAGGIWGRLVSVYELTNDTTVYTYPEICYGDSVVVGNSVYTQSGVYTNVFLSYLNTDSVVITNLTVHPLPSVLANASDTIICSGDSVVLTGSGALTYNWNNGVVDNQIFSPAGNNTYIVTGTDANGCVSKDSIEVLVNSLPAVLANTSDTVVCLGDSIILSGSGALTYAWNNLAVDSVLFAPLATSYFVVNGTDTNGCTNQDSIEVIVNALPLVMANASDTSLCLGDSVILFGSGALNYIWNNAVTDSMIFVPTITNNYVVTGTDTNGCVNMDSIIITVNALPNVVANVSDTSVCIGNQVILFGTGADSFSWNNSVIDSVAFYPIDTAMYVVTGIDVNGCIGQDSIEVITYQIPFPILVFSGDTLYCTNISGVNYYWFKDTVAIDSLINYYVVSQNGNYEVLVVDSNGCVGADTFNVMNLSYYPITTNQVFNVFPNPTSGILNIEFESNKAGKLDLVMADITGRNLFKIDGKKVTHGKQKLSLDLNKYNLKSGIYFLNLRIDNENNIVKIEYIER